jgi:HEAT repeat protein
VLDAEFSFGMTEDHASIAAHSTPPTLVDKETAESARDVLRALVKTLKAYKMYLPEHAIRRRFREELHARFRRHLEEHGDLVLTVRPYELWCGSTVVYEESNRFENIAFRWSGDGLRALTFHQGLTAEEIEWLVGILAGDTQPLDDDIVTRLWEQRWMHITYLAAEPAAEGEDGLEGASYSQPLAPAAFDPAGSSDVGDAGAGHTQPVEDAHRDVYELTEDEIRTLQQAVMADAEQDYVGQLIDILVSILALDDDEESFLEVLQILDEIVVTSFRQGRYGRAVEVVKRLVPLVAPASSISERSRELVRVVWTQLGSWERVSVLQEALNQRGTWDGEELAAYLRLLPPSSVSALVTLLERIQTAKGRRIVCEVLVLHGRQEIETLLRVLPSAPWYLARNLIYVLGSLGDERALPALEAAMRQPEVRIRKEALKAMEVIGGSRVSEMMPRWLDDPDESVRLLVLKGARRFASAMLLNGLSAMIADKRFVRRSETEQREVFETLADIGSDAVLPVFKPLLVQKRSWSWRPLEAHDSRARYAVAAVRRIGTSAAVALLRDAVASTRGQVRDEARRALRELESQANRESAR